MIMIKKMLMKMKMKMDFNLQCIYKMYMEIEMFIGMFIIQYVFMSYMHTNKLENITSSLGKIYMSMIMSLFMVLLDALMKRKFNRPTFFYLLALLLIFIGLYKKQIWIDDKNYLREMIEHHSMALFTSKSILEKTRNPAVINLATHILTSQEKEIADMQYLLKSI